MRKISQLKLKDYYGLVFLPAETKKLETSILNSRFIQYDCPKDWQLEEQIIARNNLYNKFTPFFNIYHVALYCEYCLIKEDVKFANIINVVPLESVSPPIAKEISVYRNIFFVFCFLVALKGLEK
ncbi:MAG: hypothetical protein LWW95_08530 [Candidatus Desulfofervidus auxilii]|nr:hypothetical protein [Candidatus Desulfofervidus auxilii]